MNIIRKFFLKLLFKDQYVDIDKYNDVIDYCSQLKRNWNNETENWIKEKDRADKLKKKLSHCQYKLIKSENHNDLIEEKLVDITRQNGFLSDIVNIKFFEVQGKISSDIDSIQVKKELYEHLNQDVVSIRVRFPELVFNQTIEKEFDRKFLATAIADTVTRNMNAELKRQVTKVLGENDEKY